MAYSFLSFSLLCLFSCCFFLSFLLLHLLSLSPPPVKFKWMTYKLLDRVTYSLCFWPAVPEKNKVHPHQDWSKRGEIGPSLRFTIPSFLCPQFPLFSASSTVTSPHSLFVHLSYSSTFYCSVSTNVCLSFICKAISGRCVISSFSKRCNIKSSYLYSSDAGKGNILDTRFF